MAPPDGIDRQPWLSPRSNPARDGDGTDPRDRPTVALSHNNQSHWTLPYRVTGSPW